MISMFSNPLTIKLSYRIIFMKIFMQKYHMLNVSMKLYCRLDYVAMELFGCSIYINILVFLMNIEMKTLCANSSYNLFNESCQNWS